MVEAQGGGHHVEALVRERKGLGRSPDEVQSRADATGGTEHSRRAIHAEKLDPRKRVPQSFEEPAGPGAHIEGPSGVSVDSPAHAPAQRGNDCALDGAEKEDLRRGAVIGQRPGVELAVVVASRPGMTMPPRSVHPPEPIFPGVGGSYAVSVIGDAPSGAPAGHRRSLWDYYDRRVTGRVPGFENAHAYWTGLGVDVEITDIAAEASKVAQGLSDLAPGTFVDVGAGPGTFTGLVPGTGVALDQSRRALDVLRDHLSRVPAVQADALRLPIGDKAVTRFFSSHLYGLLLPGERHVFLAEARRVASEVVIVDAGRPKGVQAEEWQERTVADGGRFSVFRRHFDPEVLAAEVAGDVLFGGRFYVLVRAAAER